jgi:hypothetical protein
MWSRKGDPWATLGPPKGHARATQAPPKGRFVKTPLFATKLKNAGWGCEEIGASGESGERKVNPGVELAKSLFFGVEVGEGVAREARAYRRHRAGAEKPNL